MKLTKRQILIKELIKKLKKHSVRNPIKAKDLTEYMSALDINGKTSRYDESELRSHCHHIRVHATLAVISNKDGYFVTKNKKIIQTQVDSLKSRAASINSAAYGLQTLL